MINKKNNGSPTHIKSEIKLKKGRITDRVRIDRQIERATVLKKIEFAYPQKLGVMSSSLVIKKKNIIK